MIGLTKKRILFLMLIVITALSAFTILSGYEKQTTYVQFKFQVLSDTPDDYQLFYSANGEPWAEENSLHKEYVKSNEWQEIKYDLPLNTQSVRLDTGTNKGVIKIRNIAIQSNVIKSIDIESALYEKNQVTIDSSNDRYIEIHSLGDDPFLSLDIHRQLRSSLTELNIIKMCFLIGSSIIIGLLVSYCFVNLRETFGFIRKSSHNKRMIFNLASNDFKTKYASSYLGIVWGFIQPLLTILTYWFVFQVGLRSGNVLNIPFILWFIAGIIPWFFFSDGLSSATNAFLEYSYLVKKVMFKIETLPVMKIMSALFVHMFFILFIFMTYAVYGYYPNIYNIQFVYYTLCMIFLTFSLSVFTSSVVMFFRDLNQIIGIVLQMGFWFTPIGWPSSMLSDFWLFIFKLNPMYYIVEGYRDSFINHVFFFEHPYYTLYFWLFNFIVLTLSVKIFNRLKPHFSDVL